MNPNNKRGRPPKYVNGSDGKPIVGLSYDKNLNQYYATHSKPRVYLGSDNKSAIYKSELSQLYLIQILEIARRLFVKGQKWQKMLKRGPAGAPKWGPAKP
jgi:hypothetical protein